jgi:N-acetylmuramoyl-L-alanine amidase
MKIGEQSEQVKDLQYKLKKVLNRNISVDGDFGRTTQLAVLDFQKLYNLLPDGYVGPETLATLNQAYELLYKKNTNLLNFGKKRFVVFVDAGHGGINDSGVYTTSGKRAYHPSKELHERGHYYEGHENRIVAEAFIEACTEAGIMCIRLYHPYKDTSLSDRTEQVRSWLKRGYYGYMHSFHSNAISEKNSSAKLESTTGYMVFTTKGNTLSDEIATQHFKHVQANVSDWNLRTEKGDNDNDFEANFQVIRETDLREFDKFGAILDEWGFHSSAKDCEKIISTRTERVNACLATAEWVKNKLNDGEL